MQNDNKLLVQKHFGRAAEAYVHSAGHASGWSLTRLLEVTDPKRSWRVLDVVTGGGHTALVFAETVEVVVAGDVTHEMLRATRKQAEEASDGNVLLCQHGAEQLPFADESFDLVTCRIAAHHFTDAMRFVYEATRVLNPGGVLAVADNMVSGEPKIAQFVNTFEKLRDASHNWAYSMADWETFFFSAGLAVMHQELFEKTLEFDAWAARMSVGGDDLTRLRALLVQAPEGPREWLKPVQTEGCLRFTLREGIIIGRKQ